MMSKSIIQYLEGTFPDKVPTTELSQWELGVLAGERMLIEKLKLRLKVEVDKEQEEVK